MWERALSRYGLEIRAALASDAPALSELLRAGGCVVSTRSLGERLDALRHEPGTVLLAGEWGPPSGLVMLHWYRTLASDQPVAQITALLVAPDDRRRGIGRPKHEPSTPQQENLTVLLYNSLHSIPSLNSLVGSVLTPQGKKKFVTPSSAQFDGYKDCLGLLGQYNIQRAPSALFHFHGENDHNLGKLSHNNNK